MPFAHPVSTADLVADVLARKHFIEFSVHGIDHWQRVERNGLYLAAQLNADPEVVSLFALFHDSQRLNDFEDPEHGARGAKLAAEFFEMGRLTITDDQLDRLVFACTHHTDTVLHEDSTIKCCWDADRLDLTRISVLPDPLMLNTESAKIVAESMDYTEIEAFCNNHNR